MSAATALPLVSASSGRGLAARFFGSRFFAVSAVVIGIIVIWYAGAFLRDSPFQHDMDQRRSVVRSPVEFIVASLNQPMPTLPSPHQVAIETYNSTVLANPTKPSSLIFHAWVTLYSTLVGFVSGTLFGIVLA